MHEQVPSTVAADEPGVAADFDRAVRDAIDSKTKPVGALVAGLVAYLSPLVAILALSGLFAGHLLMRLYFEPRLGGYTGDTLGAVQQTSEIGLYLGLAAWA